MVYSDLAPNNKVRSIKSSNEGRQALPYFVLSFEMYLLLLYYFIVDVITVLYIQYSIHFTVSLYSKSNDYYYIVAVVVEAVGLGIVVAAVVVLVAGLEVLVVVVVIAVAVV